MEHSPARTVIFTTVLCVVFSVIVSAVAVNLEDRQKENKRLDRIKNVLLVSGDALVTDEFWKITGPAGEGTLMTFSPDPRKNPVAAPVVAKFKAQNYEPEGYTLYTYGAIQAWAQAVAKAGSTDTDAVIKALRGNKFSTVLGEIGFDGKGDVTAPGYVFYKWSNGTYDYL